jgi:NAD(P)-dependent dehydrogenase (short-subunit alcohol dehydrogenase family)
VSSGRGSRTVLVTGCSSGIGLATAVAVAGRGHRVIATMRDTGRAADLRASAQTAGVTVTVRPLDVTRPETVAAVVEEAEADGGIDVLVNNAGIGSAAFFEATSNEDFEELLVTNLFGALTCTRAVLPGMRRRGQGTIVNVSSVAGGSGGPLLGAYTASKFALEGWSECLAHEVGPFGIRVVIVQPGTFRTPIYRVGDDRPAGDTAFARASRRVAADVVAHVHRRGGDPARVGDAIARIVDARRLPLRVTVGADARAELWAKRLLPAAAFQLATNRLLWRRPLAVLREELSRPPTSPDPGAP